MIRCLHFIRLIYFSVILNNIPPRRPKRKAFGIFRPFLTFAHLLVLSHGKTCWSREAYSTLCRLCACSESSAFHQATEKQVLEMKQVLSINRFQQFNTFQLLLLNTCHITHGFTTSCGCLFSLSLSSLWDLTSSFILFCVHWPVFMLPCFALLCFTLFRKGSQAPVFIWWWDLFRVSPLFLILPQHFLTLWLSFCSWLRCSRVCLGLFFCLIVGFCES